MKYMSEVIYLKNTFFHMFKYVEVVKCIEKTYLSHLVVSDSLQPHGQQHIRPPCPSPTSRVYLNPCPLSQ